MSILRDDQTRRSIESQTDWLDEEVIELSLLLPGWQVAEIERMAHSQGLVLGQLIRLLICDYLTDRAELGPVGMQSKSSFTLIRNVRFDSRDATKLYETFG